ncbi:MAG: ABC transporter [Alphaproteobacteria bacterium]|nr:ABC transporter [Alphaproteobacteria bacterium]
MNMLKNLDRNTLTVGGIVLAIVLFLAVNVFSHAVFKTARIDLTEERVFTVASATKEILNAIEEPITLKFYVSERIKQIPAIAPYAARVQELLGNYALLSNGRLRIEIYHPQQFSPEEDQAVGFGIQAVPVSGAGDVIYFGLAGTNSTDDEDTIPFFSPNRERFLEYDLSKLVFNLSRPKKTTVALISSLPITADPQRRYTPWVAYEQATQFFDIRTLGGNIKKIGDDVDILLLINPTTLAEVTKYAIDQFVMRGGKLLVFADPQTETSPPPPSEPGMPPRPWPQHQLDGLLSGWGIDAPADKVVGDRIAAQRVTALSAGRRVVTSYLPWLNLSRIHLRRDDVVTAEIERLNMTSAGVLGLKDGSSLKMEALVSSSEDSTLIDVAVLRDNPDPVRLLTEFKADRKTYPMIARYTGSVKTNFPAGPPKDEDDRFATGPDPELVKEHLNESKKPTVIIVAADADMLADQMWLQGSGNNLAVPVAQNGDLFVNLLDNAAGSVGLISLRGRGLSNRPFEYVEAIQRDAELRFRSKERELVTNLEDMQKKLDEQRRREEGTSILSREQQDQIAGFRREIVRTRSELREVQHALRRDIEQLDSTTKILNIGAVPVLVGLFAIGLALVRRARFSRRVREAQG